VWYRCTYVSEQPATRVFRGKVSSATTLTTRAVDSSLRNVVKFPTRNAVSRLTQQSPSQSLLSELGIFTHTNTARTAYASTIANTALVLKSGVTRIMSYMRSESVWLANVLRKRPLYSKQGLLSIISIITNLQLLLLSVFNLEHLEETRFHYYWPQLPVQPTEYKQMEWHGEKRPTSHSRAK
jgi:hypothetical protein